jgi:hypothetical protein
MMEDQDEGTGVAEEEAEVLLLRLSESVTEEELRLLKLVLITSNVTYEITLGLRV